MKIVIAPQAFKGTLSALEAAHAIQRGVLAVFPDAITCLVPVADGGDGTLDVLMQLPGSALKNATASDAFGNKIKAPWGLLEDGTAIIELASICGLASLPPTQRNPLIATTYGLGEVIKTALNVGCRKFLIGVGGSATQDCGVGIAQALDVQFQDKDSHELAHGGEALIALKKIDCSKQDPRINEACFQIICDVTNPLTGPEGSNAIYAPQKGASQEMVHTLEKAFLNFTHVVKHDLGVDLADIARAGAGGGAAAGLYAFLHGTLESGIDAILKFLNFEEKLRGADLVITGEGCLDSQTVKFNKAPIGVAKRAGQLDIPVIAIVGSLGAGYEAAFQQGIDTIYAIQTLNHMTTTLPDAVSKATQKALSLYKDLLSE